MVRSVHALLCGAIILAGCLGTAPPIEPSASSEPGEGPRQVVIAIIDGGVNPYHSSFATTAELGGLMLPGATLLPIEPQATYSGSLAADIERWESVMPRELYKLGDSRLHAISFMDTSQRPLVLDDRGHGTSVASLAARSAPHAALVMLQVDLAVCLDGRCVVDSSVADAMEWAAVQPWIDVISVSVGIPGNAPMPPPYDAEALRYVEASRAAARAGKLLVAASGNEPTPGMPDYFDGPPWFIAVGGAEGGTRGDAPASSRLVDVVANFTEHIATEDSLDEYRWSQGTSLAAPIVAGTIAEAIWQLRNTLGDPAEADGTVARGFWQGSYREVTALDVRRALNASARPFLSTQWDPTSARSDDPLVRIVEIGAPVILPLQQGWGYVDAELAETIAANIIDPPAASESLWATVQHEWQGARQRYWAH